VDSWIPDSDLLGVRRRRSDLKERRFLTAV
jgi:hypothetical protein